MKNPFFKISMVIAIVALISCGDKTNVVDSGTYEGTVKKVKAEKTEIYVETADGKTLELYFTDQTALTENGDTVAFSALEAGQQVEVEVKKVGKRLDPLSVQIKE